MHTDFLGMSDPTQWPDDLEDRYERVEVLGKGSFGMVWMAQRRDGVGKSAEFVEHDGDELVAIKNISIKDEKGKVYAEREISILGELSHPNVIRLIRAYPVYNNVRVVVMQLAQGPNLHQLVVKRGALGLPLSRLVSRHLIAAVGYLHGRAVIHRDIKPSNCILACTENHPMEGYDWCEDQDIWSNGPEAEEAVKRNRWTLYLVDFGFARALEPSEINSKKHLRNSIVFEGQIKKVNSKDEFDENKDDANNGSPGRNPELEASLATAAAAAIVAEADEGSDDDDNMDPETLNRIAETAARSMRRMTYEATNDDEHAIMGGGQQRPRKSFVSMQLPSPAIPRKSGRVAAMKRTSTARFHVRSMSALGTKAYAAPEIRRKLRHKTEEDFEKENAAMTECVADYGMIVDAYSVGWTLRVAMTGVPPNFTISQYMKERENVVIEGSEDDQEIPPGGCWCFGTAGGSPIRVRDPSGMPPDATLLIRQMTEKTPEKRMTVREAQSHPYIAGREGEERYLLPQGDIPSMHGDPVIPLKCAQQLSQITVAYHTH